MLPRKCLLLGFLVPLALACGSEADEGGSKTDDTTERSSEPVAPAAPDPVAAEANGTMGATDPEASPDTPAKETDTISVDTPAAVDPSNDVAPLPEADAPGPVPPVSTSAPAPDASSTLDSMPPGNECTKETEAIDCPSLGCQCCPGSYCDNGYCKTSPVATPCGVDAEAEPPMTPEQLCTETGGTVITRHCCAGAEPFGPLCGGAVPRECACQEGPTESVDFCACAPDYCFDGMFGCVNPPGDMTGN